MHLSGLDNYTACGTLYCSHLCVNETGSLSCACLPGYFLNTLNSQECEGTWIGQLYIVATIIVKVHSWCKHSIMQWHADLDECEFQLHSCDVNAECENTIGSYECHCRSGYRGNGRICNGNGVHAHIDPNNDSYHCFYNSIFHSCFVYL